MRTVNEVSKITGVSIRTLHYYDQIGLLKPSDMTDSGYRLYDDTALERLQQILLFRELEFPLKEIAVILDSADFDRNKALDQQIELLTLKREYLDNMIAFARGVKKSGGKNMDFQVFDTKKIDEYTKKAKAQWGDTKEYKEFEEKSKGRSKDDFKMVNQGLMGLFTEFGSMMNLKPEDEQVQGQVQKLQQYITANFYECSETILAGLGQMYAAGGEFTENIDKAGGEGCAVFTNQAIQIYCAK